MKASPFYFSSYDMPHATIETNRTCNIQCENCYNIYKDFVKDLDTIKSEIDLLLEKRNAAAITLIGGEPTLHKDLPEIVAYVKSKKVKCHLLSNGVVFLDDDGNKLLEDLKSSGIDRIYFHIDYGQQHIHSDIEKTREMIFEKMEAKRIHFALSITVDIAESGTIGKTMKRYGRFRYFDGLLAIMATKNHRSKNLSLSLNKEQDSIHRDLSINPSGYFPSSKSKEKISWLIYFYLLNATTQKTFEFSSVFLKWLFKFQKITTGRFSLAQTVSPLFTAPAALMLCLLELIVSPKRLLSFLKWFSLTSFISSLRMQFIVIQQPPEFDDKSHDIEICLNCPDATIRNGRLMPLCLADNICLLEKEIKPAINDKRYELILQELNRQ